MLTFALPHDIEARAPKSQSEAVACQQLSANLVGRISQCARFPEIGDVYSELIAHANYGKIKKLGHPQCSCGN